MRFPYSLGDNASTSPPSSAKLALIVGLARAALISRLSVSMISTGVFFGAPMPAHAFVSKSHCGDVGKPLASALWRSPPKGAACRP
jgi:hypothetical protein